MSPPANPLETPGPADPIPPDHPLRSLSREELIRTAAALERQIGAIRRRSPGPRTLVGALHSGELLVKVYSSVLYLVALAVVVVGGAYWLGRWAYLFYALERWPLVFSFVDQMVLGAAILFVARTTMIRAALTRSLPRGRFLTLRLGASLVRWLGEFLFFCSVAFFVHTFVWLLVVSQGSPAVVETPAILALLMTPVAWLVAALSFLLLPAFYSVASAIDVFLFIEHNTREWREETTADAWEPLGRDGFSLTR